MTRKIFLVILDIIVINLCYYLGFLLKFDWQIPARYWEMYMKWIIPIVLTKIVVFALFGLYRIMWRYADFKELFRIFMAIVVANVLTAGFLISMSVGFPRSVMALVFVIDVFFVTGTRYLSKARKNLVFSIPVEKLKSSMQHRLAFIAILAARGINIESYVQDYIGHLYDVMAVIENQGLEADETLRWIREMMYLLTFKNEE